MAKKRKKYWFIAGIVFFVIYLFVAAGPVPEEIILKSLWIGSLEAEYAPVSGDGGDEDDLIPFTLGDRFGYMNAQGGFVLNRPLEEHLALSSRRWIEYGAKPAALSVRNPQGREELRLEHTRGYPFFLGDRLFLLGDEQNSLSSLDSGGAVLWTYDFPAPLTCIDASPDLTLTGSLDGAAALLDGAGRRIFSFEPGGSRLAVIVGCAISRNGSLLALISGIDDQRFLLLERYGEEGRQGFKVVYHEFIGRGFRRPVHISFINNDRAIIFEREDGLGIYTIASRNSVRLALEGEIAAVDAGGEDGRFFVVTSPQAGRKQLVGIERPGRIFLEAPFTTRDVFFGRRGGRLYLGGGATMASFALEKR
jgi:hypothetical protein